MKSDSARAGRLAAALKENLKRRKAQAQAKEGAMPGPPKEAMAGERGDPAMLAGRNAIGPKAAPKHG